MGIRGSPRKPTQLRRLTAEDLEEIGRNLKFSAAELEPLRFAVDGIIAGIESYQRIVSNYHRLGGRKATIQFFKRLSGALDRVATCLADNNANTDRLLRDLLAEPLSVLLDHRAFVRLIGADLEFGLDELHSDERVMNERDGPMGSVWAELASRKHDAARSQPSHLLHRLFEVLNQPIRSYLDVERQNKGGAPGQPERKHVIERLVPIFSKLTGNEPTSTPNGAFMVLCELVLNGLGFETDGLEKAVQRILVQRHR